MLSLGFPSSLFLLLSNCIAPSPTSGLPQAGGPPMMHSYTPIFTPSSANKLASDSDVSDSSANTDANANAANFDWKDTSSVFLFGDSYTQTGWDVTKGVNSSDPGATSSNGPNWIQALVSNYSPNTSITTYNFAHGGATIDQELVYTPPTITSLSDQVALFDMYLSGSPEGAEWTPENSLFVCWIGINDVIASYLWTNTTHEAFFEKEHTKLLSLLSSLRSTKSSKPLNFLLMTVPPLVRSPLILSQGAPRTFNATQAVKTYNEGIEKTVATGLRKGGSWVGVFDTSAVFDTLLDNAPTLGFNNATGFNELYAEGTPSPTTQIPGYPPVSSYFWLNALHPTWSVHVALAHAVSTFLGAY